MKLKDFFNQLTQSSITVKLVTVMGVMSWTIVFTLLISGPVLMGERLSLAQQQPGQMGPPSETNAPVPPIEPTTTPVLIETAEPPATLEPIPTLTLVIYPPTATVQPAPSKGYIQSGAQFSASQTHGVELLPVSFLTNLQPMTGSIKRDDFYYNFPHLLSKRLKRHFDD